jgi:hypothetical protein
MMNKWQKFKKLSWAERVVILESMVMFVLVAPMLRFIGFGFCIKFLNLVIMSKNCDEQSLPMEQARKVAHLVNVTAYHMPVRANCLQRSMVLWWMLRREGIMSKVRFGARKESTGLAAHAWVELNETVLNDSDDIAQKYIPLTSTALMNIQAKGYLTR